MLLEKMRLDVWNTYQGVVSTAFEAAFNGIKQRVENRKTYSGFTAPVVPGTTPWASTISETGTFTGAPQERRCARGSRRSGRARRRIPRRWRESRRVLGCASSG
jgi:hypothetical protein